MPSTRTPDGTVTLPSSNAATICKVSLTPTQLRTNVADRQLRRHSCDLSQGRPLDGSTQMAETRKWLRHIGNGPDSLARDKCPRDRSGLTPGLRGLCPQPDAPMSVISV
jgi:hypothetical protein